MKNNDHKHHSIDYIEIAVTNMKDSTAFYSKAFNWEFNDYGPTYQGIKNKDREVGGFRLDSNVTPGGPLIVLYSKDLKATLIQIKEAKGEISKEPFEFPGGRRFHFKDPSGNELAVWSEQ